MHPFPRDRRNVLKMALVLQTLSVVRGATRYFAASVRTGDQTCFRVLGK